MNAGTQVGRPLRQPTSRRPARTAPIERARHYQDLAHTHPDEKVFWLCRASYFGRLSTAEPRNSVTRR